MSGEGSVFRRGRDGAWVAQLSSGPRGHRSVQDPLARTKAEARRKLEEMKADRDAGLDLSKLSLGDYLRRWLDESARPTVSANTLRGYEDVLIHLEPDRRHPARPADRRGHRAVLQRDDDPPCRRQGPAAGIAEDGQERPGHAPSGPRPGGTAGPPQAERRPRSCRCGASPARAWRRSRLSGRGRSSPPSRVTARGRLRARVRRSSVVRDPRPRSLGPRSRARDRDDPPAALGLGREGQCSVETKTAVVGATIPLPTFVVERLRDHLARQDAERPIVPFGDSLVFVTGNGLAVNGSWFTKHFQALLRRAGLPTMRLHDMRHGAASLLVDAGAHPRVAQELLRHAPGSRVTMERYAHVTAGQQRQAADLLELRR